MNEFLIVATQILATLTGLISAFLLFKLEFINKRLLGYGKTIAIDISIYGNHDSYQLGHNDGRDVLGRVEKAMAKNDLDDLEKQLEFALDAYTGDKSSLRKHREIKSSIINFWRFRKSSGKPFREHIKAT